MEKQKYVSNQIPILDNIVSQIKVIGTFTKEQLSYVCALAHAYEESENKILRAIKIIKNSKDYKIIESMKENNEFEDKISILDEILEILEVSNE